MLAVIDETTPFIAAGVCYGLVSCVLLTDEDKARRIARSVVPKGRQRPFHWHKEGIQAKERMVDAAQEIGVLGRAIVVPCSRRRQEAARAVALEATARQLAADGCTRVLIETRTEAQDGRDRAVILDFLRAEARASLDYRWVPKSDELLWIADAVGGVVVDHLIGRAVAESSQRLAAASDLTIEYRALPPPVGPKKRQSRATS